MNFFDILPGHLTEEKGLVIINPPYGLRIGTRKESFRLFRDICHKLEKDYTGWNFGLIVAQRWLLGTVPFPYREHPLYHGGLKLSLLEGKIS